ncbi:MAG TPA: MFS transporter, partial [Blastocatellia bacterium]|nr:MFS transporter [Blastocatellia bacterium]
ANAVALYFLLPESLSAEHRSQAARNVSLKEVLARSGNWQFMAVIATWFFATVPFAMLTATFALFATERFRFEAAEIGFIFAYLGLLGAVIQGGLIGRLVSLFGDKALVVAGTAIMAASMMLLPVSETLVILMAACTGIAVGNSLIMPTLNGLASKSVGAAWQGRALGVLQSAASLARIIGPVLGGVLLNLDAQRAATRYGRTPFWVGGAIMLIALAFSLTLHAPDVSQQGSALESQTQEEV